MTLGRLLIVVALIAIAPFARAQSSPSEIPSSVFASLDGYTQAEISPDGSRLAYLYPLEERQHLVIHSFATGANAVIPPIGGLDFTWLAWANDETVVFAMQMSAVRDTGITVETEETRLIGLNVETQEVTPLIKPAEVEGRTGSRVAREYYPEPQIQDDVIDWMPDDPEHIRVAVDEDFDGRWEVREVEVSSGDYRIVRNPIDGIQNWVADQDGEIRLGFGVRNGERRVLLRDANGEWPPLKDAEWYADGWRPEGFTTDPDVIYVAAYGPKGTIEYRTLRLSSGEFVDVIFSNDRYDADTLVADPRNGHPIGVSWVEHWPKVEYFDPGFAALQATVDRALAGSSNFIRSATHDLRTLVIESRNSYEPGMILIWDRDAGTMDAFGWMNQELDPELTAEVRAVEYEVSDGTVIPAYLTLPLGVDAENLPAVVLPHGGPASRDDASFWFLSQFLVSRGYAVLQPNFRGSTGYGWKFRNAGRNQWGGLMQSDVDAGAEWLSNEGIADPARICIVGWSYGGYSAAMGLINSPELYRCGVGINGAYNLPQLIADGNRLVTGTAWTRHIGLDGERARGVSPHHLAERVEAPILLIHAEDDHRVVPAQAEGFLRQLERHDKHVELITVPHGGHSMVNAEARQRILDEVEAFLGEHIGGD